MPDKVKYCWECGCQLLYCDCDSGSHRDGEKPKALSAEGMAERPEGHRPTFVSCNQENSMSKNMVERVARAIFDAAWDNAKFPHASFESYDGDGVEHNPYRRSARAAIEAMREPTEAMVEAGYTALYDQEGDYSKEAPEDAAGYEIHWEAWAAPRAFSAMITAALKP